MNSRSIAKYGVFLVLFLLLGGNIGASAAGVSLATAKTSLGKIMVNGKGMTVYFYDMDKVNSKVSACTGGCATNWPPLLSTTTKPKTSGISGKITVLPGTKQIAVNGRPLYTFIGDATKGAINGQGVGGVWFAVSPNGTELKSAGPAKSNETVVSPPTATPKSSSSPDQTLTPAPTESANSDSNSNYNY